MLVLLSAGRSLDAAQYDHRLVNLSTRAPVGTDANIVIAGFAVGPGGPKQILVRAIGPGLSRLGVAGTLVDPVLRIYNSDGIMIAENDNWELGLRPTFLAAGAFDLVTNSRDAVMVITLGAGNYTAQVSGANSGTGIALVEIYDLTGAARLLGLSTRAQVTSGASIVITGVTIAPDQGTRRVLIRAAGPGLAALNVSGVIADPTLAVLPEGSNVQVAANDNWSSADTGALSAAFAQVGAFPFPAQSKDAALVADLKPGNYTVLVSGVDGRGGVSLVEIYDLTSDQGPLVGVAATTSSTDSAGAPPAVFTIARTGSTSAALPLRYTIGGSAVPGTDYAALTGTVTIPAGASSATVLVAALPGLTPAGTSKTVTLTLDAASAGYAISAASSASVTLFANPGTLYLANLRPTGAATSSTAYGTATIQLSPDGKLLVVSATFANLSSPQTLAYVRLGGPGEEGVYLFQLPPGPVNSLQFTLQDTGTLSVAAIQQALREGRVHLSVETASFPGGELRGQFAKSSGSALFVAPAAPPALPAGAPSLAEAARFLTQATFGATRAQIDEVVVKGYGTWLAEQRAKPRTLHRDLLMADFAANNAGGQNATAGVNSRPGFVHRQNAWWKTALTAEDQLRQRVAFALSEIFVISDDNGTVNAWQEGMANYYDLLARNAFGSFRTLLEDVTLSPMMGFYLSHFRNAKATGAAQPDENYAREVMQLFTIGLNQLQPDGTLKLDGNGLPIATYDQTTIGEMAKVFTGWAFNQPGATPNFRGGGGDANSGQYLAPMMLYPAFHDTTAKTIVDGLVLPAGQDGVTDLKATLDALFNHANTGPFISRRLIQRLVTSNPSPAYVYRVAQVFADNGAGQRGDLGAVVQAILLDYEARAAAVAANPGFGKLKEPLLRTTAVLRAFNATSNNGRFAITNSEAQTAQASLSAATVFNFFEPDFVMPGALAEAGLYAPEYQILTATTALSVPNYLYGFLYANKPVDLASGTVYLDLSALAPLVAQPAQLVHGLDLLLCAGAMPAATRDRIVAALRAFPANTSDTEKIRSAIYLTVSTPAGVIQK